MTKKKNNDSIIELSKSYVFEGNEITKLDLTKLDDLSISELDDLIETAKEKSSASLSAFLPESSVVFAICAAQKVTGLPFEFFDMLGAKDGIKLRNRVSNFLY